MRDCQIFGGHLQFHIGELLDEICDGRHLDMGSLRAGEWLQESC